MVSITYSSVITADSEFVPFESLVLCRLMPPTSHRNSTMLSSRYVYGPNTFEVSKNAQYILEIEICISTLSTWQW